MSYNKNDKDNIDSDNEINSESDEDNNKSFDECSNLNIDKEKVNDSNDIQSLDAVKSQNNISDCKKEEKNKNISNSINEIKYINFDKLDYFDIFKCGWRMRYNCNAYLKFVKNKSNISINNFKEARIVGEGNCYYKCLSKFLYCKTEYDDRLRRGVITFCKTNISDISNYINKVEAYNYGFINTIDYINDMDKKSIWAPDIDFLISSFIFGLNIGIYKYTDDKQNIEYTNSFIYEDNNLGNPTMILIKDNTNHYNLIYPYSSGNNDMNEKTQFDIDNDELNPYPKYLGKDKNLYFNIFNFLNEGIINGKRKWPNYIDFIQDKKFRDKKKSEFYKKIGVKNECNMHNLDFKKKVFKYENFDLVLSQDKYIVENNRLYLTRYEYNNITEKKLIFKKYLIPYKKEIDDILIKYHDDNNHPGRDETITSIKNDNYYWISITTDVEGYLKNCPTCANKYINSETNEKEKRKKKKS